MTATPDVEVVVVPRPGLVVRIYRTMHEPEFVTAMMVGYFSTIFWLGLWVPLSAGPTPPVQAAAALFFLVAGALGVPAVWTGWRKVEKSALVAATIGWLVLAADDILWTLARPTPPRTPGVLLFAVAALLFLHAKRLWSIRHQTWAQGKAPDTPRRRAERAADVERVVTQDMARYPQEAPRG